MPFRMQPGQFPHGGYPEGDEYAVLLGTAETWPKGTPLTWNTTDDGVREHGGGATVTNILGISLEGVTAGVSSNPSGKVNVAKATRSNIFVAKLVNGSGVVQVPDANNLMVDYGMLKVGTGATAWWGVDEADTTDVVLKVIGIDLERDLVFFKFIESAIQEI